MMGSLGNTDGYAVGTAVSSSAPADWRAEIRSFARVNTQYYERVLARLDQAVDFAWSFNWSAALAGPIWMAARRLWTLFWMLALLETIAVAQIATGLWAHLGKEEFGRASRLAATAKVRLTEAEEAARTGGANATVLMESGKALEKAAGDALQRAETIAATRPRRLTAGIVLLVILKVLEGGVANWAFCRRFEQWRANRSLAAGVDPVLTGGAAVLVGLMYVTTAYRFASDAVPAWLVSFPADDAWRNSVAGSINAALDWMTRHGSELFDGVSRTVRVLLDLMEVLLVGTPWPVVMVVVTLVTARRAGWPTAAFTAGAMAYLAVMGLWERSMGTVALLGTASAICILIGVPLGIWCAKKPSVYAVVRPFLDLMQTMPPFVYLIPAIAFFGIGKVPGILSTVVFGLPPSVHLTVLGLHGVPASVREAATAFGVSKTYLLLKVELPLALPSIMTGISQTTIMCLSMVVVASLIGAKGLGEDILYALNRVAPGQGVVAGIAILFCAIVLDRVMQGKRIRRSQ
jgi:glycine betaine/proline transport system permease protein